MVRRLWLLDIFRLSFTWQLLLYLTIHGFALRDFKKRNYFYLPVNTVSPKWWTYILPYAISWKNHLQSHYIFSYLFGPSNRRLRRSQGHFSMYSAHKGVWVKSLISKKGFISGLHLEHDQSRWSSFETVIETLVIYYIYIYIWTSYSCLMKKGTWNIYIYISYITIRVYDTLTCLFNHMKSDKLKDHLYTIQSCYFSKKWTIPQKKRQNWGPLLSWAFRAAWDICFPAQQRPLYHSLSSRSPP